MGRSKKQTPEIEQLHQEIKNLKSINRHLERELKKSHQPKGKSKAHQDKLIQEEFDEKDKENICQRCQKGRVTKTSLGPRIITSCSNNCGFREIVKNEKKKESEEI